MDENVFAYSNRSAAGERGLVIHHNKFAETRGWIRNSAAYKVSGGLAQRSLAEGLDLPHAGYAIFRDFVTHLEYIRSCAELWEKGLYLELAAYQHHAFLDWRFVDGPEWQTVFESLNGAGVDSIHGKWQELFGSRPEEPSTALTEPKPKKTARKKAATKKASKSTAAGKTTARKSSTKEKASASKKSSVKPAKAPRKTSVKPAAKAGTKKPAKPTGRASKKSQS